MQIASHHRYNRGIPSPELNGDGHALSGGFGAVLAGAPRLRLTGASLLAEHKERKWQESIPTGSKSEKSNTRGGLMARAHWRKRECIYVDFSYPRGLIFSFISDFLASRV